ncbi:MAG TPA: phosphopantetheine-binding protein [Polyangiales bacterium]|nr:phosphopantetheine-binding protein [Polyangiales bacterium]
MRMTRTELIGLFERTATEIAERDIKGLSELTEISTLGIDSLGILELVGEMEKQLNIQLPDDQLVGLTKIGDLLDLVEKRRQLAS